MLSELIVKVESAQRRICRSITDHKVKQPAARLAVLLYPHVKALMYILYKIANTSCEKSTKYN